MACSDRYRCARRGCAGLPGPEDAVWDGLSAAVFVRAEDGGPPALATRAKLFYDPEGRAVYAGFWAEDDAVVSEYRKRDDPIYRQDVLELFVSDGGDPRRYKELQVSPFNVQYDADIAYHDAGRIDVAVGWNFPDWQSATRFDEELRLLYSVWRLGFAGFSEPPAPGLCWPMNLYRCDHGARGPELSAWQATGAREFHVPERFGRLAFE